MSLQDDFSNLENFIRNDASYSQIPTRPDALDALIRIREHAATKRELDHEYLEVQRAIRTLKRAFRL